jgi:hypothetical protein
VTRRTSNSGGYGGGPGSFGSTFQNPITPSPYITPRSQQSSGRQTVPRNPYANRCAPQRQPAVVIGREWNSSDAREAHPHLTGRVRLDRQFGSALEIMSGREEGRTESNQPTVYNTINNSVVLDDSDDGDDDDLLSYVAFSKKK